MDFGRALEYLKSGLCVARRGWNGKGMYLYLWTPTRAWSPINISYEPCIVMFTAQGKYQPGWLASQADMLADDWEEVEI